MKMKRVVIMVMVIVASFERPTKAWDINFPSPQSSCPLATPLSLNVCVALLGIHVVVGDPHMVECCDIITGLGVDATICLCTTIHLKVLRLHVDVPLALKLLVKCGGDMYMPNGLTC